MVGQQENVADWLRRCSIFVQPSFQEGLPLALQEAMAAGCPVLATLVAGNPELVADGKNGFLVEAGNISALKDRLQWLMDHPLDREKMGREGAQRIRELGMTRQSMIRAHDELYRKVAEGNSR
jgi:glycosyltransferase involved in cell wall biosynthesis